MTQQREKCSKPWSQSCDGDGGMALAPWAALWWDINETIKSQQRGHPLIVLTKIALEDASSVSRDVQ